MTTPDHPKLPPLVGPFKTRNEAGEWARLNIPNGSWEARPLAWPYMRLAPTALASDAGADS